MVLRTALVIVCLCFGSVASAEGEISFKEQIQPILVARCAKCHGASKAQARLRLDDAAGIEEKLATEPELLIGGEPEESELYQRLVLPADSPKRMPKGGDPLPQDEIHLIATWIKQGAKLGPVASPLPSEKDDQVSSSQIAPAKPDIPEVSPAPSAAIERLTAAGAQVRPLYAGSNLLEISFANRSQPATDEDVALLATVAEQAYSVDLAGANVSTNGLAPLAKLKHLSRLHLENSAVTDEGLVHLSKLPELQYLNLYGTSVTDAGLAHLNGLKYLSRLYLWQTAVTYDAAMSLEREHPGLIVNIGFDHPEVLKRRLTKELEMAQAQLELSKARAEEAKAQLKQAEESAKTIAERIDDIEKRLGEASKTNGS